MNPPGTDTDSATGHASPDFDALLRYAPVDGQLARRAIVITGAADGIGRAVAAACARHGAHTILVDCNEKGLDEAHEAFVRQGWPAPALCPMDLARCGIEDFRTVAFHVGERYGHLDGLVNHAGWIGALAPFEHTDPSTWGRAISIGLAAPYFLTQWCMPLLRRSPDPAVVFSLDDARRAHRGGYGIAKAGLEGLVDMLADEYHSDSPCPLRVAGIDPGPVMTSQRRRHYPGERPGTHPGPDVVVGPYLYMLGPDAGTGVHRVLRRKGAVQSRSTPA